MTTGDVLLHCIRTPLKLEPNIIPYVQSDPILSHLSFSDHLPLLPFSLLASLLFTILHLL